MVHSHKVLEGVIGNLGSAGRLGLRGPLVSLCLSFSPHHLIASLLPYGVPT